jgi:hypothetical protein
MGPQVAAEYARSHHRHDYELRDQPKAASKSQSFPDRSGNAPPLSRKAAEKWSQKIIVSPLFSILMSRLAIMLHSSEKLIGITVCIVSNFRVA